MWAFSLPSEDAFSQKVMVQLLKWVRYCPQEKVYLHTDRDHYEVGDKVWFRAYLTNASTHQLSWLSSFVYVELRDRQDSLYCRLKIPLRDSVFAGFVPLADNLPQGDYFLRSYSYWMQNAGDEFIFRKRIRVINPESCKVQPDITWEKNDKEFVADIRLRNSRNESYDKIYVDYVLNGKLKIARTDERGSFRIKLDSTDFGGKIFIRFKDEVPFEYEQTFYLPDPREDFDVAFLPEGGNLLEGYRQTIAVKAIGTDGLSREVSGVVMNDKDEQVGYLQTIHKGMGTFELTAEPGRRYYALLSVEGGEKKRFELPEAVACGVGLKVMTTADMVGYVVMSTDSILPVENLYIMAHSRGVPLFCQPVHAGDKGKLLVKDLPEGILHFLLLDDKSQVYSERLCFIQHRQYPEIRLSTAKPTYYIREQVELDMQILAGDLCSKQGSFSMAVTDDGQVERDSLQHHLLSYLLMGSDLKGHIEDPAFYFRDRRVTTLRFLNLLMMTQGWSRFSLPDIIRDNRDSLVYYMERGQAISGQVKNFWGKDASEANLILFSNTGLIRMVDADPDGRFTIDGISFPDSTRFMLQGKSKRGRRSVEVLLDKEEYLKPSVKIPFNTNQAVYEDDFYKRFTKDYYYDHGIKVYILDEAVVRRRPVRKMNSFYDQLADYTLDSAKLAAMADWDMRRVLQEFSGIDAYGDTVRRFGKRVLLFVNDFEEDYSYVQLLRPEDLVNISFIRPPMSVTLWGDAGANGAIAMTTNPHYIRRDVPRPNMLYFSLLGYQKKAEFYMPHYEVDSVRVALADSADRRPTVYWNPAIRTDSEGKARCTFNTSDSFGPYTVIIEGILKDGTLCRKEEKIKLKSL